MQKPLRLLTAAQQVTITANLQDASVEVDAVAQVATMLNYEDVY